MKQPNGKFNLYQYSDFRAFLKDALKELKDQDAKYSQRFIMQRVGVKSSGWLSDILGGRRKITSPQLLTLSSILRLNPREELYLETLCDFSQAKSLEEKNRCYEKLLTFHEIPKDIIGKDRFEYFSKWYYTAIREYLIIKPFRGNYAELAKSVIPNITVEEAKASITLLEKLGFIKKYAGGEYKPAVEHVKKEKTPFSLIYYYQYIQTNMSLGQEAVERFTNDERDISALAVTLSEEGLAQVKDEIRELRKKIVKLSEAENKKFWEGVQGDSRRVYQGVFQFFPLTEKVKKKRSSK